MKQIPALIVFSHLRWDFVYQRPQHLLSRLAKQRRILYIEEPLLDNDHPPHWEITHPAPNITVCCPRTPIAFPGFHDEQMPTLKHLLKELIGEQIAGEEYLAWFYTPMALPLLDDLSPPLVIYDCMDALDAFLHAPVQLRDREAALTVRSDLVFTGGPSLYRRKQVQHSRVYCFPSSVDAAHFSKARSNISEPADQRELGRPRLGYFGVIDERIDLALLETIAKARPDWEIVMVGPVAKISSDLLPRLKNIHYFGKRDYSELPSFLKGWDVCLMPFALNESTRFISPTKVLEYMAAERPIVSTMITDVAEPYAEIVHLAHDAAEFEQCCEQALTLSQESRTKMQERMRDVLSRTSWDQTAKEMEGLIESELSRVVPVDPDVVSRPISPQNRNLPSIEPSPIRSPVVVIGAGPTGLSAAYHLGKEALVLERNSTVGGWCRSIELNGFTFDYAGHIMFSNDPYVHEMYSILLGDNVHWQDREAWVFSKDVYTRYPFQGALYGLPANVIRECIMGAIEARYGDSQPSAQLKMSAANNLRFDLSAGGKTNGKLPAESVAQNGNGQSWSRARRLNGRRDEQCANGVKDCCADGVLESSATLVAASGELTSEPKNFEEFIYKVWGRGIAEHFAIPYNKKLWAVPLSEMETSWLGGRVPLPNLEDMIEGALSPVRKPMGPNARFGYPLRGGFQALMDGFLPYVSNQLRLNSDVLSVSPRRREVTLKNGTRYSYDFLISTMPLPVLICAMGEEAPQSIRDAANRLRYVSVRCVHLGVGRESLTEKHWIYYPEDTVFHRIFVQGNASPNCSPPGGFGLTCEITYSPHKPLPCDGDELIERCIADCRQVGIIAADDPILAATQVDLPFAYVVYDHQRAATVKTIRDWLGEQSILLAGRYSEWEYYNSDHAFIAGKRAAEQVCQLQECQATYASLI